MRQGLIDACDRVGFPYSHGGAFQEVADETKNIIVSRAPGKYATGLIEESYATKGFAIKAKSCDWGPMAGFVLLDPHFSKQSRQDAGIAKQADMVFAALAHGATSVPLFISEFRRQWLIANFLIQEVAAPGPDEIIYRARAPAGAAALPPFAAGLRFPLRRLQGIPDANEPLWSINCLDTGGREFAVEALVNPHVPLGASYRRACTADYDLFAVWPRRQNFVAQRALGVDRRPVDPFTLHALTQQVPPADAALHHAIKANVDALEVQELGNISLRIEDTAARLNMAISRRGYRGGNIVHHSDEAGRPFVNDIDLPVIAFVPNDPLSPFALESLFELSVFIREAHAAGYVTIVNPAWSADIIAAHRAIG